MPVTGTGAVPTPIDKKPAKSSKRKRPDKLPRKEFWSKAEERRYKTAMKRMKK